MGWRVGRNMLSILVLGVVFQSIKGYHHHTHHHQPPRITEHPVDTVVAKHDPATLKCEAAGQPPPTITWYKEGAPVKANQHRVLLPNGGLFFLRVAHGRKENDSGVYWCEASNALGKARSRNATLTVAVLREDFRLEPQSTRVSAGEDVVIECQPPKGSPDPRVTWRKDGKPLTVEGRLRLVDGFSLAISQARANDDGRYQCVASNPAGSRESAVAVLTVYVKPFMIRPPSDITALVDSTVEFSCAVGGDPVPDVLWRRSAPGGTMPLGRVRVLEDRTLRLERVTLMDQGTYTCDADNFAGAISASAHLTVLAPPTFSTRPSAQTVEVGQHVSFRCKSEGSPTPFLYWAIEGDRALLYPGAEQGGFEVTDTDGVSTLILKEAQIQNSGTVVICSAVNSAGSASTRTRLTVTSKEDRPPPVIVTGPVNQTLPINSMASITCEAQGNPAPFISWYKGGVPVSSSPRLNMSIPNRITITDLQEEDTGPYTCVASSRFGKAVWTGYLLVANPKNPNINFFKAPEPPMLPGAPGRPHALNQSEGSVTITWGANNKIGSSSLLGYQVELFGREENVTPTWTVVGRRVPGTTFTQHLLTAGVPYTFLVRAENAHGIGPPSQLSEPIVVGPDSTQNWGNPEVTVLSEARANLMTPDVVKLVEGIALSSTAIKVSWMISDSTYVEGLYIYYVSLNADSSNPRGYSMLTVLHTGGSSSFTVNNLKKWSSYQFFLVPFFKTVEGFPSNSRTIKTLEDAPTEPPSHMEALLLNSTTVFLKWRPPTHSLNGELQGYRVEVRTNGTDVARSVNVNKIPNLMLNNLTAGVSYYVKVAAMTKAGVGPYNAEATLRLEPASRVTDNIRRPLDRHPSGDFITETWFMALLVSMVSVMVFLFVAMMLVRRRQLANGKKSLTPRTNGHILKGDGAPSQPPPLWLDKSTVPEYTANGDRSTPLPDYARACAGIRRDSKTLANGSVPEYHGSINLQANPLHPEFSRPDSLHYSSEKYYPIMGKYKDYSCMQVQEYASPNLHPEKSEEYAEVNTSGNNGGDNAGKTSPAPYATTTLVAGAKKILWTNFAQSCSASIHGVEDPPYPSLNGGYYNRKVYSDSYFSPTHTLRRPKRDRDRTNHHPPELVSPSSANGSVYARVGPPGGATTSSWRSTNGAVPSMSSFAPPPPPPAISIYQGPRSEPENML